MDREDQAIRQCGGLFEQSRRVEQIFFLNGLSALKKSEFNTCLGLLD